MAKITIDATIFIDANAYLSFYQAPSTKQLLDSLLAQSQHVFVTQQIVNEVQRNKLGVAQSYFVDLLRKSKLELKPSENLFGAEIQEKMKTVAKSSSDLYKTLEGAILQTLDKISKSEDDMSKGLESLFAR